MQKSVNWQIGITTVPSRVKTLFPRTMNSLVQAGFNDVYVYVDGDAEDLPYTTGNILGVTERDTPLGVIGNWITGLWDLYIRNPEADRYAMFQDDIVLCRNVRRYLDQLTLPDDQYWNLFSFMKDNEKLISKSNGKKGFIKSSQYGRGATALIFPRSAVVNLLSSKSLAMKPQAANKGMARKRIDGGIATALSPTHKQARSHTEYMHNPSLVQHLGHISTLGNHNQPQAKTFPGEEFDCMTLLEERKKE